MERISQPLAAFLFNSLWQVTIIAAVGAGLAWLMRSAPAGYRHSLWVIVLVLSVGTPIISIQHLEVTAKLLPAPSSSTQPATVTSQSAPVSASPSWLSALVASRRRSVLPPPALTLSPVSFYLVFLVYRLIRLWRGWRKGRSIAYVAFGNGVPASVAPTAVRCRDALGLDEVPILSSPSLEAPLTLGVGGPVIILPAALLENPTPEALTTVIGHEMAHIKRRDFVLNLIYEILYMPISFHPAAALVRRRIAQTRELACDEMVTERLLSPSAYARSLVDIAGRVTGLSRHSYTLGVYDAGNLEERIMKLTDKRPRASARAGRLLLTAGSLILLAFGLVASAYSLKTDQSSNAVVPAQIQPVIGTWKGGYNVDEMIKAGLVPESEKPKEGEHGLMIIRREIQINLMAHGEELTGSFMMHQWLRKLDTKQVSEMQGEFPLIAAKFDGKTLTFAIHPTSEDPREPDKHRMAIEMTITSEDTAELWFVGARQTYDTTGKLSRVPMKREK